MPHFFHYITRPSFSAESSWRIPVTLILLGLLGAVIYGNALNAPFVFDDTANITRNPHIRMRKLSLPALAEVFKSPEDNRPLANLSFAFNYYLHGYHVTGYHLVNLIIHLINGLLVCLLARQTLRFLSRPLPGAPFLAAALWLANPVHIQSVTYTVQRMNSLAAMFYLASLALYIQARSVSPPNTRRGKTPPLLFAASAVSGLCALATKESAVTLPLMIILYEWFFIQNLKAGFIRKQAGYLIAAAAVMVIAAFIYLRPDPVTAILSGHDNRPFNMKERLLTQPRVIVHYLTLLLLPLPERLNITHQVAVSTSLTNPPATLPALLFLLLAVGAAIVKAKSSRLFSFSILWFLGTQAVESSVIGLELMFEHRAYLPSVFPFIAAGGGLLYHVRPRWLATVTLALLIVISGFWTRQRNADWADEIRFWQDAVRKTPKSFRPYNDLGIALARQGRYKEGITACRRSIALSPPGLNTANPHNNIGRMYLDLGDHEKAIEYCRQALLLTPDFPEAHMNLGKALLAGNRPQEAGAHLETAVRLDPYLSPAYPLLARARYRQTGDIDEAADICRRAMLFDAESLEAEAFLGFLLQNSGDPRQALVHLRRVLDKSPSHPQANLNAGLAFNKLAQPEQAVACLTQAAAARPDDALTLFELGSALMAVNRLDEAEKQLVRSLDLSPGNLAALIKLAGLNEQRSHLTEAAHYYRKAATIAPDSPQCLNQLAGVLTRSGKYDEAAAILMKLEQLLPEAPTVSYNLACLHARMGRPDRAAAHLRKALEKGFDDREALLTDSDLETIRHTADFQRILHSLEK